MRSQTESRYIQTIPDRKRLCREFCAFTRILCFQRTFVRSPEFRAFMSILSCVHQTFVRSCQDFWAFNKFPYRSPDFRVFMSRLSCVHKSFMHLCPDFFCVHVPTFVRSPDFRAITRFCLFMASFSCVHQTLCSNPILTVQAQTKKITSLFQEVKICPVDGLSELT